MNATGVDPGTIALNMITYFGGAQGAYIGGAAILLVYLMCAGQWLHPKAGWTTVGLVMGAWVSSWVVRQLVGWA